MNSSASDWELLARAGDDAFAFQTLFEKHKDYAYRLARGFLNDAELANDAVQEVFMRVYRAKPPEFVSAKFSTWLYRVTLNTCRDMQRKRVRHLRREIAMPDDFTPASADIGQAADTWLEIETLLSRLPERQREVLILRYFEGLSTRETAEVMECSEGTVKTHLHRAVVAVKGEFS